MRQGILDFYKRKYPRFNMEEVPLAPGIYKIRCVETGRIYIGCAKNIYTRALHHRKLLHRGEHFNTRLQEDFNRGYEFVVEIVELREYESRMDTRHIYATPVGGLYNEQGGHGYA